MSFDHAAIALIISAILAGIRIFEFVNARWSKIRVVTALNSLPEVGNEIIVLNGSATPLNIYYFDIVWLKPNSWSLGTRFFRKQTHDESPVDIYYCNVTVPPHGQTSLKFEEMYHFDWGVSLKEDIYLRLWLVGRRRPTYFWVTGPRGIPKL